MVWADVVDDLVVQTRDAFGVSATHTPSGGSAQAITGIFDEDHVVVRIDGNHEYSDQEAVLTVRLEDCDTEPAVDDDIVISGTSYVIDDVRKDGTGAAELVLKETSS